MIESNMLMQMKSRGGGNVVATPREMAIMVAIMSFCFGTLFGVVFAYHDAHRGNSDWCGENK